MRRLSRVLCAVAIDDRDTHVFAHALALARRHAARLLVLHAASPEVAFNRGATERVDFLRQLRSRAEAAGVDVRVDVQRGPVADLILLHARARRADVIVLGTARNERRRGLSGWIAEQVLRDAPCPTLVVPPTSAPPPQLLESILCAVDFSPASHAAVREAVSFTAGADTRVTLLHVVDAPGSYAHPRASWLGAHEYDRGRGATALDKLRFLIPPPDRSAVLARVSVGRPAAEIVRIAQTVSAQLIVIGAARRNVISGRLFGKTGRILRDATCPVLAVPAASVARQATEPLPRAAA